MKGSRLLLIVVLLITAALGATAIWIGWRLSREEEVAPEEAEAWSPPDGTCHPPADCDYNHYDDCSALNSESGVPTNAGWYFTGCNSDCPGWQSMEIWVFVCRGPMSNGKCEFCSGGGCNMTPIPDGGCRSGSDYCVDNNCGQQDNPCHCCYDERISAWNESCLDDCIDSSPGYNSSGYGDLTPAGTFDGVDYDCRNIQVDAMYGGVGAMVLRCQKNPDGVWEDEDEDVSWTFDDCQQVQRDLSCDSLSASPSVLTTDGGDVTLTTQATATNVTITNYEYGADFPDPDNITDGSATATWNIPANTPAGTYTAWVNVTAEGYGSAGCTTADSCTPGAEACQVNIEVTEEYDLPAFDTEKTASVICINDDTAARITYFITVTNISTVEGDVYSVTDTYDSRFERSWVDSASITPPADNWEGNIITWDNNGNGWTLQPGEELIFSYIVTVPKEYFGVWEDEDTFIPYQYRNFAVIRTETEDFEEETEIEITCAHWGVFDNAVVASLVALFLLSVGVIGYRNYEKLDLLLERGYETWPLSVFVEKVSDRRRKSSFEKRSLRGSRKKK